MTPSRKKKSLVPILLGAVVVAVLVGMFLFIRSFLGGPNVQQPKVVQEVHLIRPPPPPPEETPPPPPPPEEKVVTPQDQPKPDPTPDNQPPPSQNLGLDAEGGAGGDAFGLVGNKGGRDLLGGGGSGSAAAWYGNIVKNEVMDRLSSDKALLNGSYQVSVRFWFSKDGTVEKLAVVKGSGDRERDRSIETLLSAITRFAQPPPAGVPSPITLTVKHG